ncbi:hypothetical protein [Nannocystis sp.]|uniref:hypothetical protein n=1 Tax=Nannocystis sp. TaxID=1962667 RepID=UPI0025F84386|nr:hypothetical protein [Nannocystis sp.]MBK7827164.1 hypothetical protein [Nannocystis sp.]
MKSANSMLKLLGRRYDAPEVKSLREELMTESWPSAIAADTQRIALSAKASGVDLTFLRSNDGFLLHQLNFWSSEFSKHGYSQFSGELPKGMMFGQKYEGIVRSLGEPKRSRAVSGTVRGCTWILDGLRILAQYSAADGGLSSLECARAEESA